jgi:hypothetical protein
MLLLFARVAGCADMVIKTDDIMNTSTVYIMLAIVIIAVIGCATFFILMKAKKLIYKNASYY